MLDGGNDSFNMLAPVSEAHYRDYQNTRGNLALDKKQLLKLDNFEDAEGRIFGLHPAMTEVQELFHNGKLAFVANIGPLVEPLDKETFASGRAKLPLGLLSHADQVKHWETSRPDQRLRTGWFGYFADALHGDRSITKIPMNISLSGSNIIQNGMKSSHYSVTSQGSVGLVVQEEKSALNTEILDSFISLLSQDYGDDPFKKTYLSKTREAQARHETYRRATAKIDLPNRYSNTELSQQLKQVAKAIKASKDLDAPQQTFFIRYIGWDHHDEVLNNQQRMLRIVSEALGEFQSSLDQMGLADQVITFTGSDFGRTLTSNGNGSDHGWGGNIMVMGSDVEGGKIYGKYPDLKLGDSNPLDVGGGVLIPTTATDQLYAELALWFGLKSEELNRMFPNLHRFHEIDGKAPWLGVVRGII